MTRHILAIFGFVMWSAYAFAGGGNNVSAYNNAWGGATLNACGAHSIANSETCIGDSQTYGCQNWKQYARNYTDEFAIMMMLARKVTETGAYFCPVQAEGKNRNKKNGWTEYADPTNGNDARCVWLCKAGFTGAQCDTPAASVSSCDTTELKRTDYSDLKVVRSGANIEDSVAMFVFDQYYGCGMGKGEEHDIVLAITRWAPSGHGAWVRQMVVRAERRGWKSMDSTATIYPATNSMEILVCKNGYQPNAGLTDCVAISDAKCAEARSCAGWTGYDEASHKFIMPTGKDCYEFRCKESGFAFASAADRSCIQCASSLRGGASPITGECITCETGHVFNDKAASTGYCGEAMGYTKTDMQYGKGKTKNNVPDVEKQCWTKIDTDAYRSCVINGGVN